MKKLRLALALVLLVLSIGFPVSAANTTDTSFSITCPDMDVTVLASSGRAKTNATSVYVNFTSSTYGMTAYGTYFVIYGGSNSSTAVANVNCNQGAGARMYGGQIRAVRTMCYENGYAYAFLGVKGYNNTTAGETVKGKWSPDSSRYYTPAN